MFVPASLPYELFAAFVNFESANRPSNSIFAKSALQYLIMLNAILQRNNQCIGSDKRIQFSDSCRKIRLFYSNKNKIQLCRNFFGRILFSYPDNVNTIGPNKLHR